MTIFTRAAAALATALLLVLIATPADAESVRVGDPADATPSPTDIRQLRVSHTAGKVLVRIRFVDLATGMDNASSSASIYFDTRRGSAGPEYRMGIPLFEGSDWAVERTDGWRGTGDLVNCRSQLFLVPRNDVARLWVRRGCLDHPGRVRVSVKMVDWSDGSHPVRDWAPERRGFTRWLSRA
jgi:hypothetical protein